MTECAGNIGGRSRCDLKPSLGANVNMQSHYEVDRLQYKAQERWCHEPRDPSAQNTHCADQVPHKRKDSLKDGGTVQQRRILKKVLNKKWKFKLWRSTLKDLTIKG
ncbi:hypothetical protein M5689_024987 [Euphorbia peplus]|nr:hypothetical protein M5689_024987 [Euphorbia peplus]